MENNTYNISVFTENSVGMLNRITIIFTRRNINIESITASESEIEGIHRYTIVVNEPKETVRKVVSQIEKQIDVVKAFYHSDDEVVYQEIALYKLPTIALASGGDAERIVRAHHARILTIESEFTILEKTGYPDEIKALFTELKPFGLLEFVRSGRVAISKPMKTLEEHIEDMNNEKIIL
ncbi:MAG: acetolactate synthase small subunit [Crocinitomicaceae bacterium]|jgi:acetolactate synthase-1/3 small subunit